MNNRVTNNYCLIFISVTVSESMNSMDVLSGGESDAGDTLSRRNNNRYMMVCFTTPPIANFLISLLF